MKFLVTNDDGIDSRGLSTLSRVCESFGEVAVVAPRIDKSGVGHQVTVNRPLIFDKFGDDRYCVEGSPADCIRFAVSYLQLKIDWVVSGINVGANLGVDIYTSGTLAAAREAAILGYPGVALSQYYSNGATIDWDISSGLTKVAIAQLIQSKAQPSQYWNVNLPCTSVVAASFLGRLAVVSSKPDPSSYQFDVAGGVNSVTLRSSIHERQRQPLHDIATCLGGQISASLLTV